MRVITHCPACQTQFFATEEQLNQHGGKVRCGQCMQVFDARAQLISVTEDSENTIDITSASNNTSSIKNTPALQTALVTESATNISTLAAPDTKIETPEPQPSLPGDTIKNKKKNKSRANHTPDKSRIWIWSIATLILILIASLQSIYFLRDEIAVYYPNAKPYLVQACQKLACTINLPKKIDFIVIDDSDMQEDAERTGLVHFASTLINNGSHVVAYPNLELTLTDVDDKPVIRRIFKPNEYLPAENNITDGIQAGEETRIKLAITTTSRIAVSGYRVFVTY